MILAEYSKEGKFESFLELGTDFAYYGNYIIVTKYGNLMDAVKCEDYIKVDECYFKDEKDPLERFRGLFDGRTYGNGKYVLIRTATKDIRKFVNSAPKLITIREDEVYLWKAGCIKLAEFDVQTGFKGLSAVFHMNHWVKCLGNLHQQPELITKL